MKKLLLCLLLVSPLVLAVGEETFQWIPPTEYEDNTPLPANQIESYDIVCNGQLLVNVPNNPLDTDTYEAPPNTFPVGVHSCVAHTWSTAGVRSVASGPKNFTVAPGRPKPPVFVLP